MLTMTLATAQTKNRLLTEITTASTSGISSILHGGSVYLFGPRNWVGEHLSLNTGSNSTRAPLPSEATDGSSTRKQAWPNHVALISPWCSSSVPHVGILTGIPGVPAFGKAGMLREAWANYQAFSDERARAKTRTILNASILPLALQLGQGFWNHTGLSEVQWAGRPPFSFLLSVMV